MIKGSTGSLLCIGILDNHYVAPWHLFNSFHPSPYIGIITGQHSFWLIPPLKHKTTGFDSSEQDGYARRMCNVMSPIMTFWTEKWRYSAASPTYLDSGRHVTGLRRIIVSTDEVRSDDTIGCLSDQFLPLSTPFVGFIRTRTRSFVGMFLGAPLPRYNKFEQFWGLVMFWLLTACAMRLGNSLIPVLCLNSWNW